MKKIFKLIMILFIVLAFTWQMNADDKELYLGLQLAADSKIKPNVIVLFDNSSSMGEVITHPAFVNNNNDGDYAGIVYGFNKDFESVTETRYNQWRTDRTGWVARWIRTSTNPDRAYDYSRSSGIDSVSGNDITMSSNYNDIDVGDWVITDIFYVSYGNYISGYGQVEAKLGSDTIRLTNVQGTFSTSNKLRFRTDNYTFKAVYLYGSDERNDPLIGANLPSGEWENEVCAKYDLDYLRWIFFEADSDQRADVSHFSIYGTFDRTKFPAPVDSSCKTSGQEPIRRAFTRSEVAREVICQVARDSQKLIRLGLWVFYTSQASLWNTEHPAGGTMLDALNDMDDAANKNMTKMLKDIYQHHPIGMTPLGETLADIWYYLKPGPASKEYWPVDMELDDGTINTSNAVSPIEWYCQGNYVVVMTDGEPNQDDFSNAKYNNSIFTTPGSYPIQRVSPWNTWTDGWGDEDSNTSGNNNLDDVAYFMYHQDMFPDSEDGPGGDPPRFSNDPLDLDGWPDDQNVITYTIGFNVDNQLLQDTATHGHGKYYQADNFQSLIDAFRNIFTDILLRSYAFASITAPIRSSSTSSERVAFIGYFIPDTTNPLWEGFLATYEWLDTWGFDLDDSGEVDKSNTSPLYGEFSYATKQDCLNNSSGKPCERWYRLTSNRNWNAGDEIKRGDYLPRNLWTHVFEMWWYDINDDDIVDTSPISELPLYTTQAACETANPGQTCKILNAGNLISFETANNTDLQPLLGAIDINEANTIINKISEPHLADPYHADVLYVGPPIYGLKYVSNIDPLNGDAQTYQEYYDANKDRQSVVFTGTNGGVLHMFNANIEKGPGAGKEGGREMWGLVPDSALPKLKNIVVGDGVNAAAHTYTVDGRIVSEAIYYIKPGDLNESWCTVMIFGLREGGRSFYGLDIDASLLGATPEPNVLWKFMEDTYSGNSWGKPIIGKVYLRDPADANNKIDKWVAVLTGGYAPNNEDSNNPKGKAVFIVDASNGELLWMVGYNDAIGEPANGATREIDMSTLDDIRYLTKDTVFNYPVPSSLSVLDKNNDGLIDSVYFGNLGGHMFKIDMSSIDTDQWKTYLLYETDITDNATDTISAIVDNKITIGNETFTPGQTIIGSISKAVAYVEESEKVGSEWVYTLKILSGTFQNGETVVNRSYDPIYFPPAVARDQCGSVWVTFGTGDRDRPRSNPDKGHFFAFLDDGSDVLKINNPDPFNLQELTWTNDQIDELPVGTTIDHGWYFAFPDPGEKLFDPEPIILPDQYMIPHIHFNTYQPPSDGSGGPPQDVNICSLPQGSMTMYDVSIEQCLPIIIDGERVTGRIAGGGMYQGAEYVMFTSEAGLVADVPSDDGDDDLFDSEVLEIKIPGGILFLREKNR